MASVKKKKSKASQSQENSKEITALKNRIAELEKTNEKLVDQVNNKTSKKPQNSFLSYLKTAGVIFFVTLSIVAFTLFNVSSWVKSTVLDTDTFIDTAKPLIEQPEVQKTLQQEITNAIFKNIDVEEELASALPENVAFLAGPLAGQIESFTNQKVGEVLASEQLAVVWETTLEAVHGSLVEYITNDKNDGVLNINELYEYTSEQLQDTQIAFLLNKQLPDSVGQITLIEIVYLDEVRSAVNIIDKLPTILLITSALSFVMALLLAKNMRRVIIVTIVLAFIMAVSTLLAIYILGIVTSNQVEPIYKDAANEVFAVISDPLVIRTQGYLVLFGTILTILLITSKASIITKTTNYLNNLSISVMNKIVPSFEVPSWLEWTITSNKVLCWTVFYTLLVVLGLRIPPSAQQVITAFLVASITAIVIYLGTLVLATAKTKTK